MGTRCLAPGPRFDVAQSAQTCPICSTLDHEIDGVFDRERGRFDCPNCGATLSRGAYEHQLEDYRVSAGVRSGATPDPRVPSRAQAEGRGMRDPASAQVKNGLGAEIQLLYKEITGTLSARECRSRIVRRRRWRCFGNGSIARTRRRVQPPRIRAPVGYSAASRTVWARMTGHWSLLWPVGRGCSTARASTRCTASRSRSSHGSHRKPAGRSFSPARRCFTSTSRMSRVTSARGCWRSAFPTALSPISATSSRPSGLLRRRWSSSRKLARSPTLAVLDGVTNSMTLEGLSLKDNTEVAQFYTRLPRWIARRGPAVLLLDHVAKSIDGRGRFALGAQAKLAEIDGAAYTITMTQPFGRAGAHRASSLFSSPRTDRDLSPSRVVIVWSPRSKPAPTRSSTP